MHVYRLVLSAGLFFLLAPGLSAQTTQAVIRIGGPGSCSSTGSCDPALISDGVTEASVRLLFELDTELAQLTLVVANDSPVVPGIATPLLARA
jgi:hypothetical protein